MKCSWGEGGVSDLEKIPHFLIFSRGQLLALLSCQKTFDLQIWVDSIVVLVFVVILVKLRQILSEGNPEYITDGETSRLVQIKGCSFPPFHSCSTLRSHTSVSVRHPSYRWACHFHFLNYNFHFLNYNFHFLNRVWFPFHSCSTLRSHTSVSVRNPHQRALTKETQYIPEQCGRFTRLIFLFGFTFICQMSIAECQHIDSLQFPNIL